VTIKRETTRNIHYLGHTHSTPGRQTEDRLNVSSVILYCEVNLQIIPDVCRELRRWKIIAQLHVV